MNKKIKLHHFAYNIKPNTLELVVEMFKFFDCEISYREWNKRWCMIEQKPIWIDIQIIETEFNEIKDIDKKIWSHIAFLSDSPEKQVNLIEKWCLKKWLTFRKWSWNDKEFWFDIPEIFSNFVIEIMDFSVVE
jgi:hypothetical protein